MDVPVEEHTRLFLLKLSLCKISFNFNDPDESDSREAKRCTLIDLVDYVNTDRGQQIFQVQQVVEEFVSMVSFNLFRALPPPTEGFDPDEDEPVLEQSWPHLQVVYELLLRFIVSREVVAKSAKRRGLIDTTFCLKLVQIFDSEDPRERDYLKTILHRIYGKFMSHRGFIRKQMSNTFQRYAFETYRHHGIAELLEILGSIINGFALPLKPEHLQFLVSSLIPLHKVSTVNQYHQQLQYCIVQFVVKESVTIVPIIQGLSKYWPWSNSSKQVLFLNELEEILEHHLQQHLPNVHTFATYILKRSLMSEHFQVVERALYYWNNDQVIQPLLRYSNSFIKDVFPILAAKKSHWNSTVTRLVSEVQQVCKHVDAELWESLEQRGDTLLQSELLARGKRIETMKLLISRHSSKSLPFPALPPTCDAMDSRNELEDQIRSTLLLG